VQVKLLLGEPQKVMVIPQTALMASKDRDAVYVVKDNKAILTTIKILKRRDNDVLIAPDLEPGAKVVTAGQMKLRDQAPVAIPKE